MKRFGIAVCAASVLMGVCFFATGCGQSGADNKMSNSSSSMDKMGGGMASGDKMTGDKMSMDKMGGKMDGGAMDKMSDGKMSQDKMSK